MNTLQLPPSAPTYSVKENEIPIVLVSDDGKIINTLKSVFLSHEGYELIVVSSLTEVLEAISKLQPIRIFWDYELGKIKTLSLLETVRNRFPQIAVVAYCTSSPHREELKEKGCSKEVDPLDVDRLSENIFKIINTV